MAWMFHGEPLGHWLHHLPCDGEDYSFVWVLEDDIGFSGSIQQILDAYSADPEDLISGRWLAVPEPREPRVGPGFVNGWYWYYTTTSVFEEKVAPDRRLITEEHVQRISLQLLREVDKWCRMGASACSEQLVPTVAYVRGMLFKPLRPEHIGDPFHYEAVLSEEEWAQILARDETPGRFYHALKF